MPGQRIWYIFREGNQTGPISQHEFDQFVELGHLRTNDLVWHDGADDWKPGSEFLQVTAVARTTPPPLLKTEVDQEAAVEEPIAPEPKKKSWLNAGTLFWIFMAIVLLAVAAAEPEAIPYRVAGAINGAIFGAVAAGLAAAIQYLIQKKLSSALIGFASVLGFIAGQATENSLNLIGSNVYDAQVQPRVSAELMLRKVDEMPFYQALKRANPTAYAELRAEVSRRAIAGATGDEIQAYTAAFTSNFRRRHADAALKAPREYLAAVFQVMRKTMANLQARSDGLCAEYVLKAMASPRSCHIKSGRAKIADNRKY